MRDPTHPPYVSVNHLRDSLIGEHLKSKKQRLWEDVRRRIRGNSCIKESIQIIGGEEHRVWEWNGRRVMSMKSTFSGSDAGYLAPAILSPISVCAI